MLIVPIVLAERCCYVRQHTCGIAVNLHKRPRVGVDVRTDAPFGFAEYALVGFLILLVTVASLTATGGQVNNLLS